MFNLTPSGVSEMYPSSFHLVTVGDYILVTSVAAVVVVVVVQ